MPIFIHADTVVYGGNFAFRVIVDFHLHRVNMLVIIITKLVPWGTDGRLPLSDLDLDLGSGHTAYRRASLIDLYLRTKFH